MLTYLNKIAKITGIGYLIIFVTGFFSNFFVVENLVVPNDVLTTFSNLTNNETLFRLGIFSFIIMVIIDLFLSWTFYLIFETTNRNLSIITAWLRLANAVIFGLALTHLFNLLNILDMPGLDKNQISLAFVSFNNAWLIGLVFFGIHLLFLGYLIVTSNYIPKVIGILLVIAAIGYLVDSSANLLLPNYQDYKDFFTMIVMLPGIVGELSLALWLLIKGIKQN